MFEGSGVYGFKFKFDEAASSDCPACLFVASCRINWSRLPSWGDGGIRKKPKDSTSTRTMAGLRRDGRSGRRQLRIVGTTFTETPSRNVTGVSLLRRYTLSPPIYPILHTILAKSASPHPSTWNLLLLRLACWGRSFDFCHRNINFSYLVHSSSSSFSFFSAASTHMR